MKIRLSDVAVHETRLVEDPHGNYRQKGWWDKNTGRFLGKNKTEAADTLECEFPPNYGTLSVGD